MNFLFSQILFVIKTIGTSADRRAFASHLLTTTVVILAALGTVTTFKVDLVSFDNYEFFFKGFFIYSLCLFNHELTSIFEFFSIQAIVALTRIAAVTQFLKTRAVKS